MLKNNFPRISIITPSYNQGQYIEQTIQSVLNQNYPNLEYIVIDGGSTDESVKIIKKYERFLTYWISEKDKGQSDAINKGLQKATGDIINWLNADDYYEPTALLKVAKVFNHTNALMVSGKSRLFKNKNETVEYSSGTCIYPGNLAKTIGWAKIDQPATFFHSSAIQKIGLLNNNLHYIMDKDWLIQYLFHFGLDKIVQIPDVLVNFRLHDNSKTVSLKESFVVENDAYYCTLANAFNLHHFTRSLNHAVFKDDQVTLKNLQNCDIKLVEAALNYYMLLKAIEAYIVYNKSLTKKFFNNIKADILAMEDRQLWQRLGFKIKYVPFVLIKLLKKQ
ncbi:glycosyltransferase family 2 protein [Rhodocytophaga aerolata]|uniref:Glycosyltransferase family 2 protein n=1 Tax=Rhodocytophaga aerolata TaxID=455078 RepID=A0ABT8R9R9_9BACT|nr:glycosyltransferase family 2 protein [Rhodocytophaga aerolata]MDO1448848.1 glycosyltransferase family 2 protein [Rhodocytophaga aerolata]